MRDLVEDIFVFPVMPYFKWSSSCIFPKFWVTGKKRFTKSRQVYYPSY